MYHLRLIKGLSYSGAVSATKDRPDVFVEDENKYQIALQSGYFEEITDVRAKTDENSGQKTVQEENEFAADDGETKKTYDTLSNMNATELKAYASLNGINISGMTRKGEILEAIKAAEKKADEARAALRYE